MEKKEIKFNIDLVGKPGVDVATKSGKAIVNIFTNIDSDSYPIIAFYNSEGGKINYDSYTNDGRKFQNETNSEDLVMFAETKEYFTNVYRNEEGIPYCGSNVYENYTYAVSSAIGIKNYLKTIKIHEE